MEVISSKEFFHKGLLIERTPNIKGQRPGQKRLAVKLSSCNDNLENKKPPKKRFALSSNIIKAIHVKTPWAGCKLNVHKK